MLSILGSYCYWNPARISDTKEKISLNSQDRNIRTQMCLLKNVSKFMFDYLNKNIVSKDILVH